MTTRTETRFGLTTLLGTGYVSLGTVPGSTTWNLLLNVTNRQTSAVTLRAYIADSSWSTGEPTGGTLKAAILYDLLIPPNDVFQLTGIILLTTEQLIVRAGTASSLDVTAQGLAIT